MKTTFIVHVLALLILSSCGENKITETIVQGTPGAPGKDGSSCSTQQLSNGALISCTDGTSAIAFNGVDGSNGSNGTNGTNGTNGSNGSSCSVSAVSNGALVSCTNGSSAVILNGTNGTNAPTAFGIKDFIFPCGDQRSNDEIFFRMTDGSIVALYDGGPNLDRLTRLQPGNYVTTDSAGTCNIRVDSNLNLTTSPIAATGAALNN